MPKFNIGDTVYVPRERLQTTIQTPYSLIRGQVTALPKNRTVTVDCHNGIGPQNIASSAAHKDVGVCVIRVGDYQTETTLLNPLTKSLVHFLRLLAGLFDESVSLVG
jgi:hypothetical protein